MYNAFEMRIYKHTRLPIVAHNYDGFCSRREPSTLHPNPQNPNRERLLTMTADAWAGHKWELA